MTQGANSSTLAIPSLWKHICRKKTHSDTYWTENQTISIRYKQTGSLLRSLQFIDRNSRDSRFSPAIVTRITFSLQITTCWSTWHCHQTTFCFLARFLLFPEKFQGNGQKKGHYVNVSDVWQADSLLEHKFRPKYRYSSCWTAARNYQKSLPSSAVLADSEREENGEKLISWIKCFCFAGLERNSIIKVVVDIIWMCEL